jgi:hypothetical protein
MEHHIKDSGETVSKRDRVLLSMLTVQCIPASSKMISQMDKEKRRLGMAASTLELLRMVTSTESENTDNQTNRLSMKECG